MKINEFFKDKKNIIAVVCVLLVAILLVVHTVITNNTLRGSGNGETQMTSNINPRHMDIQENGAAAIRNGEKPLTENTVSNAASETKPETTAAETTVPATTVPATTAPAATQPTTVAPTTQAIQYATAIRPAEPADYSAQWDAGYLIAIDNPDTVYSCAKVTLTDEDRDLLERLCYGEFGTGGFIGAALIAQAVKDAMCVEGYTSVAEVIRECRYDGSTELGTNDECRQAVRYIFDENCDAVQHRIMYMYNPRMVRSDYHESQNFILSYGGVRFFDKWG